MSTHRLVGGYQLKAGRLLCGCGSGNCIRIPEGKDPCPLLGEFAQREPAQEFARKAVAEIRELFEAGAAWLAATAPAAPIDELTAINAARTLMGFPRVASVAEHDAEVARRR